MDASTSVEMGWLNYPQVETIKVAERTVHFRECSLFEVKRLELGTFLVVFYWSLVKCSEARLIYN